MDYFQNAVYLSQTCPSFVLSVFNSTRRVGIFTSVVVLNCCCRHLIRFLLHQLDLPSSPSSTFQSLSLQLLHSLFNFQDSTSFPSIYVTACVAHRRRLAIASTFFTVAGFVFACSRYRCVRTISFSLLSPCSIVP